MSEPVEDGPVYTVKEAAKLLKIHGHTLYRWVAEGTVPAIRIGVSKKPRIRIKAEVVHHILENGLD